MDSPQCRRAFLARLGRLGLAVPALSAVGCSPEAPDPPETPADVVPPLPDVERPIVVAWGPEAFRILAPLEQTPMAYVSMARRQVFVDFSYRDLSNWILHAHISVSTGLWRIPLPGDPAREPITPGDSLREFEELDMSEWDPAMVPAAGDFRIRAGRPADLVVRLGCVPVGAADAWVSGGPFTLQRCDGVGETACREDFVEIGTALRHPIRGCEQPGSPVSIHTWAVTQA